MNRHKALNDAINRVRTFAGYLARHVGEDMDEVQAWQALEYAGYVLSALQDYAALNAPLSTGGDSKEKT